MIDFIGIVFEFSCSHCMESPNRLTSEVSCDHLKQESFGLKFQEDRGDFLQQRCGRPGTQVGHSAPVHRHQIHRGPELNPPGLRVEHLSQ